jgi:hypothetical protein
MEISMKFNEYIINENMVDKAKGFLSRLTLKAATKLFKDSWDEFQEAIESNGLEKQVLAFINKAFKTSYRSMEQIGNAKPKKVNLGESTSINESAKHWWDTIKTEAFPTLAFYPALSIWLEIDQLMKGNDMDMKKTSVYALFWVLLVSGKYAKGWFDWKKQNPEEHAAEKAQGKGGIF